MVISTCCFLPEKGMEEHKVTPKAPNAKLIFFLLSILFFTLFFLYIDSTFQIKNQFSVLTHHLHVATYENSARLMRTLRVLQKGRPRAFDFIADVFKGKEIKIGLVNILEEKEEWYRLGNTSLVHFQQVPQSLQWNEQLFPSEINEENWELNRCPDIPTPKFKEYGEFDVIASEVPCGNEGEKEGIRDAFRLQVNLVVANLVVRNSHINDPERQVYVVFIGSCGPMWEIFRCDDLLKHEGDYWIYKPDVRRLKQKVLLPVGSCQMSVPYAKQENGDIHYDFSKLYDPLDYPKEAYVTVLHSSETYVCGAIVLAQSIIHTNTTKDLVLLVDASIGMESRRALETAGWKIKLIDRIESPFAPKDAYNKWNYSKLRIWQLTEYDKVMFIDSDLIVLRNIDNFFKLPQLSAANNNRHIFNSGIMLIEPSECVFETLMKKRHTLFSYNGGDQGFLNEAFTWWHRLPGGLNYFKYILNKTMAPTELPKSVYALHYLGMKPWVCYRDYDCNWDSIDNQKFASDLFHERWWEVHDAMPKKLHGFCNLTKSMHLKLKEMRQIAETDPSFPDDHWKIKVMDPRQYCSLS